MSLIFDKEKDKNIAMMVETSGIDDPTKLDFTFNVTVGDVKYGFPCKLKENKVEICIPPLASVIKKLKTGKYKASLDVTGDKGFFLQPFNEEVEITSEPKVDVIVDDDTKSKMTEAITASISSIVDMDVKKVDTTDEQSDEKVINTNEKIEPVETKKKRITDKMFG